MSKHFHSPSPSHPITDAEGRNVSRGLDDRTVYPVAGTCRGWPHQCQHETIVLRGRDADWDQCRPEIDKRPEAAK